MAAIGEVAAGFGDMAGVALVTEGAEGRMAALSPSWRKAGGGSGSARGVIGAAGPVGAAGMDELIVVRCGSVTGGDGLFETDGRACGTAWLRMEYEGGDAAGSGVAGKIEEAGGSNSTIVGTGCGRVGGTIVGWAKVEELRASDRCRMASRPAAEVATDGRARPGPGG